MKTLKMFSWVAPALLLATQSVSAITINFDYTLDTLSFFADTARQTTLEAAGAFFEGLITDDLTAITSSGSDSFNAIFNRPDTGASETINDFSVASDTLTVFAGGRLLPGSTLGIGGPGGFSVSGTSTFVTNAITRGETPSSSGVQGASATDFAPWGGAITFDTGATWDFDLDPSNIVGNDFFSVALHELAHLLGFGTADSWNNLVSGNSFTGAASVGIFGSDVPLDDSYHWLDGTMGMVGGSQQETAMDPSIQAGTRKVLTNLDTAALADIGWELNSIPVPPTLVLLASGLAGLLGLGRTRRRS